jgi:flagellin
MRAQLRGLGQAIRNANDGISLLQTAEGALEETHAMLHRLAELSTQAANDTYDATDRIQIQREATELLNEITRIAMETDFNGIRLFNGSRGTNATDGTGSVLATTLEFATDGTGALYEPRFGGDAATTPEFLYGGTSFRINDGATNNAGTASAQSALTFQIGAYGAAGQRLVVNFGNMTTTGLGLSSLNLTTLTGAQIALGATGTGAASLNQDGTDISISAEQQYVGPFQEGSVRFAINLVNSQRAQIGAWQGRLESTVNNLTVNHENLTAAESQVRDADMAAEMIQFTKFNILQQSAQAMLAQANQAPQAILQLLR